MAHGVDRRGHVDNARVGRIECLKWRLLLVVFILHTEDVGEVARRLDVDKGVFEPLFGPIDVLKALCSLLICADWQEIFSLTRLTVFWLV